MEKSMGKNLKSSVFVWLTVTWLVMAACMPSATAPSGKEAPKATGPAGAPAAQGKWEQTVAAAQREGKVMFYAEIGAPVREAISKGFQNKYGIEVEFVVGKSPEVAQRFMTERRANVHLADTFMMGTVTLLVTLKPEGVLARLPASLLSPEALDTRAWPGGEFPYVDKDKTTLPLASRFTTFVVRNTDLVKENEIRSFKDLLDPRWKGKMTMFDPTISGSGNTWANLILSKIMSLEEGKNYLSQFAKQEPAIIKDVRLHVEWVARGKHPVGIGANFATVAELQAMGAPLSFVPMAEGGIIHPGGAYYGLPDKPSHPNASALLTNWLFSAEGQQIFSRAYGAPAVRLDVSKEGFDPLLVPRPGDKVYWNDEDFVLAQPRALELSKEIFSSLLK